jgi:hypothetical protein
MPTRGHALSIALVILFCPLSRSTAQVLPPIPQSRLELVNNRIETVLILGGDATSSAGVFRYGSSNRSDLNVTKVGGRANLTGPMSLGLGDLKWAPIIVGNVGYTTGKSHLGPPFDGDVIEGNSLAIEFGLGARIWVTDHLSFGPSVAGIYGHTESTFKPVSPAGHQFESALRADGLIDWRLDTWTAVPAIDAQYEFKWRRITFTLTSEFTAYHTEDFRSTSKSIHLNGDSKSWMNTFDMEVPLGLKLFDREIVAGGAFSRTDLFGNISNALGTSYFYTADARIGLNTTNALPIVRWVGFEGQYFFGHNFSGWSIGVSARI